jgi:hypothetical protein
MPTKTKRPFTTEFIYDDPDNAIDFYEEQVGVKFPEAVVDFLYAAAEMYPDALFCVQPAIISNFIAIAREGDRRSWAFVKPTHVSVWVAHSRNADALIEMYPELHIPENLTRSTRQFVDVDGDKASEGGAEVALGFAASHARPVEDEERFG